MKVWLITACWMVALASSAARSQESIDVSKITCDQFIAGKVADSRSVTIWLSGYYNGTRKNTIVDVSALQRESQDVMDYCIVHPSTFLMEAVSGIIKGK